MYRGSKLATLEFPGAREIVGLARVGRREVGSICGGAVWLAASKRCLIAGASQLFLLDGSKSSELLHSRTHIVSTRVGTYIFLHT